MSRVTKIGEKSLKDYYETYKAKASGDVLYYTTKIKTYTSRRHTYKQLISSNILKYKELGIKLIDYQFEYGAGIYKDGKLNKAAIKLLDKVTTDEDKKLVNDLILYTNTIKLLYECKIILDEAINRDKLTYKEYEEYVFKYYGEVTKQLFEGYGYNMNYHIGMLFYERVDLPEKERKVLDYAATNKAKEKLIAEGKKPYEKKMADLYAARGLKYDGVPYAVYRTNDTFCYKWHFVNSIFLNKLTMEFTMKNYTPSILYKLGYTTYEDIAKYYNYDYDKIVYSNLGLQQKAKILLNIDKTRYTKFIRFNNRGLNRKAKGTFIFRNYDDYIKHLEG